MAVASFLQLLAKKVIDLRAPDLFGGEGRAFMSLAKSSRVYGEYGVGDSTIWASKNTNAKILAVESDPNWAVWAQGFLKSNRGQVFHVDLGEVRDWGRPTSYSHLEGFSQYFEVIWRGLEKPDVVLIDGRFRVACFLTCLLFGEEGTHIIFDDYVGRPHYHFV